ncbi:hypothetical protein HHI36_023205 [Cryptolaemus montrouzieri]|uniref:ubiquitinyl hydrolase 1 n=1 Tax=Cryptolaemus montrouzieri TaxID=559131 RepID=A0ABD2PFW9_9CUCU
MTVRYTELHLANSIEGLNAVARRVRNVSKNMKFDRMCRDLEVLYKNGQDNLIDQEMAYVYLLRFLIAYKRYSALENDKNFMEIRFRNQLQKTEKQMEQLTKDLTRRYSEVKVIGKDYGKPQKEITAIPSSKKKFPDDHISCDELYSALNDPNNNILLVDARPEADFKQSRMKIGKVINVPEDIIESGLSAHRIGEALPSEYQPIWNVRDTFDIIVLLDWRSTYDNMMATKLEKLLSSLVDWDTNKTYSQKAVILNGGYLEWGQKYPSLCINPIVVINKTYNDLDELLNLDDIQYPSEENKIPIITFKETTSEELEPPEDLETREELIRKNKELSMQSEIVLNELIAQEAKWRELQNEKDLEQRKELEKKMANLDEKLDILTNEKKKTQEQFEFYARFDPQKENLEANQIKEIADIDESENQKILIRRTMAEERLDALAKARALKPKGPGDSNVFITPSPSADSGLPFREGKVEKPVINRSNKPSSILQRSRFFDGSITFNPDGGGLIGLKNIRNTCYMNTVVQCMRNVPKLAALFCTGSYSKYVRRKPDAIIMETAFLFRSLWSNVHKFFNPVGFYEKVCSIEPNYRMGNHEDCMEFFLFLLNNLSEDCAYDIQKPDVMSPAQQAWFNQLGGKTSIFTELFYHQLRITQVCHNCKKTTYKFEIESTFMLPVPEHDFRVEDLMKNYLQDYIIDDYCCSKCKKPVTNSKSVCVAPNILVIVLKRYKQVIRNNNVSVSKIDSRVSFSTNSFHFGGKTYKLNAIAMHSGSMTSGHYTAACLTNFKWYEFNDDVVRPINVDDDMVRSKACAFFYSKE